MHVEREDLIAAFDAAVAAADPEAGSHRAVAVTAKGIEIGGTVFPRPRTVVIAGLGKASPAMVRGVATAVGEVRGIVVADHREPVPPGIIMRVGGHPIPTLASVEAGGALMNVVAGTDGDDLVVFLVSGGGSAVAEVPAPGVDLDDLVAANRMLIRSGLPIEDINEVRAAMSDFKGGRLAAASGSSRVATLVLSDVVDAGIGHVASGPTLGQGLGARATEIVRRAGLADQLPASVLSTLDRPPAAPQPHPFVVVGSPALAAEGAAEALRRRGGSATILTTQMTGEVAPAVDALLDAVTPGTAVIAAGETTIAVTGDGLGGRNQHAALIAAKRVSGTDAVFGAFGTDGRDGPTDAAGAIVDGGSLDRMHAAGVDPDVARQRFDAHPALRSSGDLVTTGPTGTNVTDVWISVRPKA